MPSLTVAYGRSRSSSGHKVSKASSFCRDAGSSNAHLPGSADADVAKDFEAAWRLPKCAADLLIRLSGIAVRQSRCAYPAGERRRGVCPSQTIDAEPERLVPHTAEFTTMDHHRSPSRCESIPTNHHRPAAYLGSIRCPNRGRVPTLPECCMLSSISSGSIY